MRIKRGPSNRQLKRLLKESLEREVQAAVKIKLLEERKDSLLHIPSTQEIIKAQEHKP